jgi:hypothetical protein
MRRGIRTRKDMTHDELLADLRGDQSLEVAPGITVERRHRRSDARTRHGCATSRGRDRLQHPQLHDGAWTTRVLRNRQMKSGGAGQASIAFRFMQQRPAPAPQMTRPTKPQLSATAIYTSWVTRYAKRKGHELDPASCTVFTMRAVLMIHLVRNTSLLATRCTRSRKPFPFFSRACTMRFTSPRSPGSSRRPLA